MLDLVCTLMLVGRLCIADPSTAILGYDAQISRPFAGAGIKTTSWKASVVWQTIPPQPVNPRHLAKSCAKGRPCFSYFLSCRGPDCHVLILAEGEDQPIDMRIWTTNGAAPETALAALYYLPLISDPGTPVRLDSLRPSEFDSPFCQYVDQDHLEKGWEPGCEHLNKR